MNNNMYSKLYKIVRRSDGVIIAEGSKKDMTRLFKQVKKTVAVFMAIGGGSVGTKWK